MAQTAELEKHSEEKFTIGYALEQIEKIANDTEYLRDALNQLALMPKSDSGDIAGQEKAKAIGDIVRCREATNQQALSFYEKLYDDLKPHTETAKSKALEILAGIVREVSFFDTEQGAQILSDIFDTIRHID